MGRILNILYILREGETHVNKKRVGIRPFRILSFCLGVAALVMLSRFPAKTVSLERQREQLAAASAEYYDAQSEHNQLLTELSEINSADFVERTARRDYGYCWYGETIYEVGNLEAIAPEPEFEIFGESEPEEK